jgi:hypothetical protein
MFIEGVQVMVGSALACAPFYGYISMQVKV